VEVEQDYRPQQVIFQSWTTSPAHVLPETSRDSFTGILAAYVRKRTVLATVQTTGVLAGRLTDSDGQAVERAQVRLQYVDRDGPGAYRQVQTTGRFPPEAGSALIAIRINRECRCAAHADIALRGFRFVELQNGRDLLRGVSLANKSDWRIAGDAEVGFQGPPEPSSITIQATRNQTAQINQAVHMPIAGGSQFTFAFELRASEASNESGFVAVIFLSSEGREISRQVIPIVAAYRDGTVQITDSQGRFTFNHARTDHRVRTRIEFGGTKTLFPSAAEVDLSASGIDAGH
jgi:hypothetical protein